MTTPGWAAPLGGAERATLVPAGAATPAPAALFGRAAAAGSVPAAAATPAPVIPRAQGVLPAPGLPPGRAAAATPAPAGEATPAPAGEATPARDERARRRPATARADRRFRRGAGGGTRQAAPPTSPSEPDTPARAGHRGPIAACPTAVPGPA